MAPDRTTIQISVELWQWLNARKQPGESFDDVLRRELDVDFETAATDGDTEDEHGDDATDGDGELPVSDAEQAWYRCGYCGKVFEVPGALIAHVDERHSEATIHEDLGVDHDVIVRDDGDAYHCPDCDVSFDDWDAFAKHNERAHGRDESE